VEEIVCGNMLAIAHQMGARFYAGQWVSQQLVKDAAPLAEKTCWPDASLSVASLTII